MDTINSHRPQDAPPAVSISVAGGDDLSITIDGETFEWEGAEYTVGEELTFTANTESSAVEFRWDMGDGITRHGQTVEHTFVVPAPDTVVRLLMIDSRGHRARAFKVMAFGSGGMGAPDL